MTNPSHLGARLGPRLAELMAQGATHHLQQSADVRARVHKAGLDAFWHGVGREYRDAFGDHLMRLATTEGLDPEAAKLVKFVARQPGEGASLLGLAWYGTGLGSTFGSIISNLLGPVIHTELASNPNALLPPDLAAAMGARGILSLSDAHAEARGAAVNDVRFQAMIDNSTSYPDVGTVFQLWRRQVIDRDQAHLYLKRNGYSDEAILELAALFAVPLQPADLADMTLRGIIDQGYGRQRALEVGVPQADFDLLTEAVGEPPGPEQLVEALRRGFIDTARFTRGIRQSRVRDEWLDVEQLLGFVPMSTADAVDAVVQDHLTSDQGKQVAHLNGLEPQYWDVLVETAGEPIARGEALELYNRGEMTQAEVEQAIRESRVKNKYIPNILELHRKIPPERTVITMLAHGAIDHAGAIKLLLDDGFDQATAEAIVKAGTAQRTTSTRHLAVGTIAELYADQAMSKDDALAALKALGWSAHDAELELQVAELRREHTWRQAAAARIGTDYVNRLIDRAGVVTYLQHIGLPGAQAEAYMTLWDIERSGRVRRLTEAQIIAAAKHNVLDAGQAEARLVELGYDQADALILMHTAGLG